MADVAVVFRDRPITFGQTSTGKRIAVIWEQALDNPLVIRPVTAYELD